MKQMKGILTCAASAAAVLFVIAVRLNALPVFIARKIVRN